MNIYQRLRELLPAPALLIGEVISINTDNTSTVQFPDGSEQRFRGTAVAVGQPAFVRDGVVESIAPAHSATVIEI